MIAAWVDSRNFYILDLENFATASRRYVTGVSIVDGQLVDYIYYEATYGGAKCRNGDGVV